MLVFREAVGEGSCVCVVLYGVNSCPTHWVEYWRFAIGLGTTGLLSRARSHYNTVEKRPRKTVEIIAITRFWGRIWLAVAVVSDLSSPMHSL